MNALTVFRRASTSGVPAALVAPSAGVMVAPMTPDGAARADALHAFFDSGDDRLGAGCPTTGR